MRNSARVAAAAANVLRPSSAVPTHKDCWSFGRESVRKTESEIDERMLCFTHTYIHTHDYPHAQSHHTRGSRAQWGSLVAAPHSHTYHSNMHTYYSERDGRMGHSYMLKALTKLISLSFVVSHLIYVTPKPSGPLWHPLLASADDRNREDRVRCITVECVVLGGCASMGNISVAHKKCVRVCEFVCVTLWVLCLCARVRHQK